MSLSQESDSDALLSDHTTVDTAIIDMASSCNTTAITDSALTAVIASKTVTSTITTTTTTAATTTVLYQSYHTQLEKLKQLPVPFSDIYHALTSVDTMPLPLLTTRFRKATAEMTEWLETAEVTVFGLQMDVEQHGTSGKQDVSEIDVIMNRFQPNIAMMLELKEKMESRQVRSAAQEATLPEDDKSTEKEDDPPLTLQELQLAASAVQASWESLRRLLGRVKEIFAGTRLRGELLTQMERALTAIEEIATGIDTIQLERHCAASEEGSTKSSHGPSSPPFSQSPLSPSTSLMAVSDDLGNPQRSVDPFAELNQKIELLLPKLEGLKSEIYSLHPGRTEREQESVDGIKDEFLRILNLWEDTKTRKDKITDEVKEERWITVFEQVAGQVHSMMESMERAIIHCRGLVDQIKAMVRDKVVPTAPIDRDHLYAIFKSFEAKHKYYAPAVNKMLDTLESGIESRMTKNADVIQKHQDMKAKWGRLSDDLERVEIDLDGIEGLLDILDASIPSYIPTPPSQLPDKPLFSMRRSQVSGGWQTPGPPNLFTPPPNLQQHQRGRRPLPAAASIPVRERAKSPSNVRTSRPWSPATSSSSHSIPNSSLLSPNIYNNHRALSRSPSRSPTRANSDKLRPWCPSTSVTSPNIPGIPYSPSMASTFNPRSGSSAGFRRASSPSPSPSSQASTASSRNRSASCTPIPISRTNSSATSISSNSRIPTQMKPVFSPSGNSNRYSTASPTPSLSTSCPSPSGFAGSRRGQLKIPSPVVTGTNPTTRPRQNSASSARLGTGTTSSIPRSIDSNGAGSSPSSSMLAGRGHRTTTSQLSSQSSLPPFSPPVPRQRRLSAYSVHSAGQVGYKSGQNSSSEDLMLRHGATTSAHPSRRLSFGSAAESLDLIRGGQRRLSVSKSVGGADNRSLPAGTSSSSSSTSSSTSSVATNVSLEQQRQQSPKPTTPYIPVRGDELDEELAKIVNANSVRIPIRRLGDGKYYLGGRVEEQVMAGGKMVLCRLMESSRQGNTSVIEEDDSGVSSGGSHSGTEEAVQQATQQQQQKKAISIKRPAAALTNAGPKVASVATAAITAAIRLAKPESARVRSSSLTSRGSISSSSSAGSVATSYPSSRGWNGALAPKSTTFSERTKRVKKVAVRIGGGGWQDLDQFLVENSFLNA
ncbi:hypothetical protein BGW38_004507 [Lunasporangiospora selenospora]|uniref:GAR domain-containing protein n=1 Tax=Lunasporangiospora selenospora TaxID=979761 RepID=A0A9P6KBZ7_9FUNG|nr:hypothetical protein BGW38_004507 [Lunasporangiospora selenospora]